MTAFEILQSNEKIQESEKMKSIAFWCLLLLLGLSVSAQKKPAADKMPTPQMKTEPLKIGEIAPDFTLTDQSGKQIALSKAKTPVVLVFYRGYW